MKNIFLLSAIILLSFTQCTHKSNPGASIPQAIQKKIEAFKNQPVQNPPASIYRYDYNGQQVYYVTPPCCDRFSDLLNDQGELICHPDGGFTGKGDGKCSDFVEKKKNEMLIWKDERGGTQAK